MSRSRCDHCLGSAAFAAAGVVPCGGELSPVTWLAGFLRGRVCDGGGVFLLPGGGGGGGGVGMLPPASSDETDGWFPLTPAGVGGDKSCCGVRGVPKCDSKCAAA